MYAVILVVESLTAVAAAEIYNYDNGDRLRGVVYDNGTKLTLNYDGNGNLISRFIADSPVVGDGVSAGSLAEAWVETGFTGTELGTEGNPFNHLREGVIALTGTGSGTLHIKSGSYSGGTTLSKKMTIQAEGGPVTLGQ